MLIFPSASVVAVVSRVPTVLSGVPSAGAAGDSRP
jgi:hypothetical protein